MAIQPLSFVEVDPRDHDARAALQRYLDEIATVLGDPALGPAALDDVDDYLPPTGRFLLGRLGDRVVGCGALRTIEPGIGEIKRMWVDPATRGRGVGAGLLAVLEDLARTIGIATLRLDTSRVLTAAQALYSSKGYAEIERYNDNPDATHFFEKTLT